MTNDSSTIKYSGTVIRASTSSHDNSTIKASGTPVISARTNLLSTNDNSVILLNNSEYFVNSIISQSSGEAEIYLIQKDESYLVLKLYYPNFEPKEEVLSKLKGVLHKDIVNLIDYGYYENNRFFEIMEYAEGGSLADKDDKGLYKYVPMKSISDITQLAIEVVNALKWCHKRDLIHRDIKPENVFYKNNDGTNILIGDFGISSSLNDGFSKRITGKARTEAYAAPELYQSIDGTTVVGKEIDYYALGLTLVFLWEGKEPYDGMSPLAIMKVKQQGSLDLPGDMDERIKMLVRGLTTVAPDKRWGYEEFNEWKEGKDVPIYDNELINIDKPFKFGRIDNETYEATSINQLVDLMESFSDQGKRHLYTGTIKKWLEDIDQSLCIEINDIVEKKFPHDEDDGLTRAIYILDGERPFKSMGGKECHSTVEIGDALDLEIDTYANLLSKQKGCPQYHLDLFHYLFARGYKEELSTFRNYISLFEGQSKQALNEIILDMHGRNKFRLNGTSFSISKILKSNTSQKFEFIKLLENKKSRFYAWLSKSELRKNVDKWIKKGRRTLPSIYYALHIDSPIFLDNSLIKDVGEFELFLLKNIDNKEVFNLCFTEETSIDEIKFWFQHYQNANYVEFSLGTLLPIVTQSVVENKTNEELKEVLDSFLINQFIEQADLAKKERDFPKRFAIGEKISIVNNGHKFTGLLNNEKKALNFLKQERLNNLDKEEKEEIQTMYSNLSKTKKDALISEYKNALRVNGPRFSIYIIPWVVIGMILWLVIGGANGYLSFPNFKSAF